MTQASPADELLAQQLLSAGLLDLASLKELQARATSKGWPLATAIAASGAVDQDVLRQLIRPGPRLDEATVLEQGRAPASPEQLPTAWVNPGKAAAKDDTTLMGRAMSRADESDVPERLGPFRILEPIGSGGMGEVFRVHDRRLKRVCALKLLPPELRLDEDTLQRFVAEARLAAKVGAHPNVVHIYDAGLDEGYAWLAMELVEGTTLGARIKEGLDTREGAAILAQVCAGLTHVHEHGIVHRDLKPDNILIDAQGVPKLTDFGIAKSLSTGGSLTQTGSFLGTPAYMAPEQAMDAREVTPASDVYALGAILYKLLTGRTPHQGPSPIAMMAALVEGPPPAPSQVYPTVDPSLEAVCLKLIEREPTDRYASASEVQAALEAALASGDRQSSARNRKASGRKRRPSGRGRQPSARGRRVSDRRKISDRRSSDASAERASSRSAAARHRASSSTGKLAALMGLGVLLVAGVIAFVRPGDSSRDPEDETPESAARLLELTPEAGPTGSPVVLRGRVEPADQRLRVRVRPAKGSPPKPREVRARDGAFELSLALPDGRATVLVLEETDGAEVQLAERTFLVDATPPELSLDPVPERVRSPELTVGGRCTDASTVRLRLGDAELEVDAKGRFRKTVTLTPGQQTLSVVATDAHGLESQADVSVSYVLPELSISLDPPPAFTRETKLTLRGEVAPPGAALSIGGEAVALDGQRFAHPWSLREGANSVTLELSHTGRTEKRTVEVVVDATPPKIRLGSKVITKRPGVLELRFNEAVVAVGLADASKKLDAASKTARIPVGELGEGEHTLTLQATDRAGNVGSQKAKVTVDTQPPELTLEVKERRGRAVRVKGSVRDASPVTLTLDGKPLRLDRKGGFGSKLGNGPEHVLEAVDAHGHTTRRVLGGISLLTDRGRWNAAGDEAQDAELALATKRLAPAFRFEGTSRYACAGQSHRLGRYVHVKTNVEFVLLPGDALVIGTPPAIAEREAAQWAAAGLNIGQLGIWLETPGRSVKVKPVLVARRELTRAQWQALGALPAQPLYVGAPPASQQPTSPVGGVSWTAAQTWLKAAGGGLRLPSEAEWEYACRSGTTTRFFWGDESNSGGRALIAGLQPLPLSAGSREGRPNAFGLIDTSGNAWEWCQDQVQGNYAGAPIPGQLVPYLAQATGLMVRGGGPGEPLPLTGRERALRGGSLDLPAAFARSRMRLPLDPDRAFPNSGLRPVASLPER